MIDIKNVSKSYASKVALKDITLTIPEATLFGLIGSNGAGKTTLLKALMGLTQVSSGEIKINGLDRVNDRAKVNSIIGYVPDTPKFENYVRSVDILIFLGEMHGLKTREAKERAEVILEEFVLKDEAYKYPFNFSLGTLKKFSLACSFIHKPKILLLDEPTNGLDPSTMTLFLDKIKAHYLAGGTVLLCTHQLSIAQDYCTDLAVMDEGKLITSGKLSSVLDNYHSLSECYMNLVSKKMAA
jgi:ABC-2 type transport system ATP-binding protein